MGKENKPKESKSQIGFFVSSEVKAMLQSLAMENNRTMSGQLTEMIARDHKKMLSDQSKLLSK